MNLHVDERAIRAIGNVLNNPERPLKERFRALFTLRNLRGKIAIECIANCFNDPSALLKHECAYCLGQMQDPRAVPVLTEVLKDKSQEPMVRHEAGEALGAIGSPEVLDTLKEYSNDPVVEVAETCQLAVKRIQWLLDSAYKEGQNACSVYHSVDPAPPDVTENVKLLHRKLLDESLPLFERYKAMFSLRNVGSKEAVLALAEGLKCGSALFRHEIAYVLGQIQSNACVKQLTDSLSDLKENEMVRHECAEALGSIAHEDCRGILEKFLNDEKRVVYESCEVALDMCNYESSEEFQYADYLVKVKADNVENQEVRSIHEVHNV
ncbi:deoxyhypusine hydroxylase nero [Tachypleus tridentatus]|uniref:deoxyhypusine hydroxylase nero n=1 Tax=Tachypleus tridentatus TaxID=6853 RepID=UPI003FD24E40